MTNPKTMLITGATSGIGAVTAWLLRGRGHQVVCRLFGSSQNFGRAATGRKEKFCNGSLAMSCGR